MSDTSMASVHAIQVESETEEVFEDSRVSLRGKGEGNHSERIRSARMSIEDALVSSGKKRVTVANYNQICEARDEYETVIEELVALKCVTEGKLEESRMLVKELLLRLEEKTEKRGEGVPAAARVAEDGRFETEERTGGVVEEATKERNVVKKTRKKRKKARRADEVVSGKGPVEVHPKPVENLVLEAVAAAAPAPNRGWEKVVRKYVPARERVKSKVEERSLEGRKPFVPRTFIVGKGQGTSEEKKVVFWKELGGLVKCPRLKYTKVLPRGDLLVEPADECTFNALVELVGKEVGVRKEELFWPKVLVYDVDRTLKAEEIAGLISDQNPEIEVEREEVVKGFKPMFMTGAKDGPLVNWVAETSPALFKRLVNKRFCVGMGMSRVAEYKAVLQCHKCLHFGHMAAKCTSEAVGCGRCAEAGHISKDCKSEKRKCVNCGRAYAAGHSGCVSRALAVRQRQRRTDFGGQW